LGTRCWLWVGAKKRGGYGHLHYRGHNLGAHRVSWLVHKGPIPAGLHVLHRCDTPPCVNPAHLFVGTDQDNKDDCGRKERRATGDRSGARLHPERLARGDRHGTHTRPGSRTYGRRNGAYTHPERVLRGERHGCARLTEGQVRWARRVHVPGDPRFGQSALARRLGVSQRHMGRVLHGERWRHAEGLAECDA
jgi:hypothetical protein